MIQKDAHPNEDLHGLRRPLLSLPGTRADPEGEHHRDPWNRPVEGTRASEAWYRRLFETANDGILVLDAATRRIADANPYMTELSGFAHDHFVGKALWQIGLFDNEERSDAFFRELQQRSYVRYDHLPLERTIGAPAEVELVSSVHQVEARQIAQCNIRDIGRRRLASKTRDLDQLTEVHRRKDEFLAMLAHELRDPLVPISTAVQLLGLRNDEDPVQRQARASIERQVTRLQDLIDDLSEVSRIVTAGFRLRRHPVLASSIMDCAVEAVHPLMAQRGHELTVTVPPQPVWLYADAARLQQVLVNLLTNAAKYTEAGGRVCLTVHEDSSIAVLRVRDTGAGIAPETLPHIFDLFMQADCTLNRSQGGLGIGLALVRRLVELHGGTVEAHSTLGRGSEFVVRLPAMKPTLDLATPSHALDTAGSGAPRDVGLAKVEG